MIYTRRRALSFFESLRLTRAPEGRLNHKALRMLDIALMTHNLDSEFQLFSSSFSLSLAILSSLRRRPLDGAQSHVYGSAIALLVYFRYPKLVRRSQYGVQEN